MAETGVRNYELVSEGEATSWPSALRRDMKAALLVVVIPIKPGAEPVGKGLPDGVGFVFLDVMAALPDIDSVESGNRGFQFGDNGFLDDDAGFGVQEQLGNASFLQPGPVAGNNAEYVVGTITFKWDLPRHRG